MPRLLPTRRPAPRFPAGRHAWLAAMVSVGLGGLSPNAAAQVAQEPLMIGAADDGAACRAVGTGLATSTSTLTEGALLVQAGFVAGTWEGDVRAYPASAYLAFLAGAAPEPAPAWRFGAPSAAERNVYTSTAQRTAVPFAWCRLSAAQRALLDPGAAAASACPTDGSPLVDYLRGDAAREQRNGGPYRDRPATVLGDVVSSTPVVSRSADHAYQLAPAASYSAAGAHGFGSYRAYVQRKQAKRPPTVMFGANDGMFHVVDATDGRELFAYVPRAAFEVLPTLSSPAYAHRYSVDGPVVEGDVWTGAGWKTIAVGSTGAGPAGLFAIDVTSPGVSMDARTVLWDVTPADHPSAAVRTLLGRTLGAGVVASVRFDADGSPTTQPNGTWAYIVGNGYESASGRAALLVFDALTGALIRAIDTGIGSPDTPNGLGALAQVYDGQRNVVAVYAGDRLGHLWKFDLSSFDPAGWKIQNEAPRGTPRPLLAANADGTVRPIHQAPRILPDARGGLTVAFGTGRYFEIGDPANGDEQGVFVVRDTGQADPVAFDALMLVRTEEFTRGSTAYRRLHAPDLAGIGPAAPGFRVPLRPHNVAASRERVMAPLQLDAGVLVVSTFDPGAAAGPDPGCTGAGRSYLYRIDLAGGQTRPAFIGDDGIAIAQGFDGWSGGFLALHRPASTPREPIRTVSAAELATLLAAPRYQVASDGTAVPSPSASACLHVAARRDGSVLRIETRCAGLLPLRAWRPLR